MADKSIGKHSRLRKSRGGVGVWGEGGRAGVTTLGAQKKDASPHSEYDNHVLNYVTSQRRLAALECLI